MPANQKHLTHSPWHRAGKISAAILGGYMITASFHLALAAWFDHAIVLITSTFSAFLLWATLMVLAFLARSGWKIWGVYLGITILLAAIALLGKLYNPQFMK